MPLSALINTKSAQAMHRLCMIASVLSLAGALFIFLAVKAPVISVPQVASTAVLPAPPPLAYPHYSFFTAQRRRIFEYGTLDLVHRDYKLEAPGLPPGPNLSGLQLVASMPSDATSYAIIKGLGNAAGSVVSLGEKVRDSILVEIASDHVVLTRNAQNATLAMQDPWEAQAQGMLAASHLRSTSVAVYEFPANRTSPARNAAAPQRSASLGLFLERLDDDQRRQLDLPAGQGLLVTQVNRKGVNAAKGDLLVAVAGKSVGTVQQIMQILKENEGRDLYLTLIRDGKPLNVFYKLSVSGGSDSGR
ncbi:MAG: hypothetical protein AB7D07_14300 [Desulfovibrionaceae bacterium]